MMVPNSPAMIAFYLSCLAIVAEGRYVRSPVSQDAIFQTSAGANTAFLPSGPPGNLYNALATLANKNVASTGIASRSSTAVPKMDAVDDSQESGIDMYDDAVKIGKAKANIPSGKAFILGTISGAHIALGTMLAISLAWRYGQTTEMGLMKILLGMFGLPAALLMTTAAGGELVTGNFAFCSAAVFEAKTTWEKTWKNWATVFAGNFLGAVTVAWLSYRANTGIANTAISIAESKVAASFGVLLAKGILCNWLVAMATWMAASTKDLVSKALAVFLPVSAFVALGLEHVVANMFLITSGMYYGADVTVAELIFKNLWPVALGNYIGGSFFVAFLYKIVFGGNKESSTAFLATSLQVVGGALLIGFLSRIYFGV